MGIGKPALGVALAASIVACEGKDTKGLYGVSQQAIARAGDTAHLGPEMAVNNAPEGSQRNRSRMIVEGANGALEQREFEIFGMGRDGELFVQNCPTGPQDCGQPQVVPFEGFAYRAALTVPVPDDAANPTEFRNEIYGLDINGARVYKAEVRLGANGMPEVVPDTIVDANMSADSITSATRQIEGVPVEGILYADGNNVMFRNPIGDGVDILVDPDPEGLGTCGIASQNLYYDVPRNGANSIADCNIIAHDTVQNVDFQLRIIGGDARLVEVPGADGTVNRFYYYTKPAADGDIRHATTKYRQINPYDGDGVCAPGDVEDCAVVAPDMGVPPADAAVPAPDMNVSPPDMGVDAEVVDAAVITADANVSPDLGADAAIPPDGGLVGDAVVPDAATPDAGQGGAGGEMADAATPDMGAGGQGGAGGEGGAGGMILEGCENDDDCVEGEECNLETKECVEVTLEDFIAKVPANSDCKIVNAVDNGDGSMTFSVRSQKNGVNCSDITVQLRDIPANPVLMTVSSQADSPAGLDCEVTPGFGENSDLAMVCDNAFGSAAKVKKNGEKVALNSSNGEVAFTASGSELEMSEYNAPLNSEGILVKEGTPGAVPSPVIELTAIQHDATARIRDTLEVTVPEGKTLILDPTGLEIQLDNPDVPTPPPEEPGVGVEGGGCDCKTTNGGNVPAWMVGLFGLALLKRRGRR